MALGKFLSKVLWGHFCMVIAGFFTAWLSLTAPGVFMGMGLDALLMFFFISGATVVYGLPFILVVTSPFTVLVAAAMSKKGLTDRKHSVAVGALFPFLLFLIQGAWQVAGHQPLQDFGVAQRMYSEMVRAAQLGLTLAPAGAVAGWVFWRTALRENVPETV